MAEENEQTAAAGEPEVSEPQGTEATKGTTDWKAEARKWEARAKENRDASERLKKLEEAQMSELERARKEADEAKAEAAKLKAEKDRGEALSEAARAAGVDIDLLSLMAGDSPEQIAANAELLRQKTAALPVYPSVTDNGAAPAPAVTKEQIEEIKNPVERINARAKHPELYK